MYNYDSVESLGVFAFFKLLIIASSWKETVIKRANASLGRIAT